MGFGSTKRRKHSKCGSTTLRAYHFRLETNSEQFGKLHDVLDLACDLKNQLVVTLEASRQAGRAAKLRGEEPQYLSAFELKKQVAGQCLDPKFLALHSQVRQELSMRVTEGQSRWFEALKEGRRHVRPPSVMRRKDFRSVTYPQYGTAAKITSGKLHLSKIGEIKVLGWRKMRGKKKSLTIKFKEGHFWAIVMCQVQVQDVCRPYKDLAALPEAGFDPGLKAVLTDSYGQDYETPKPLKQAAKRLRHIQKDVSRKFEMRKKLHTAKLAAARATAFVNGDLAAARAPVATGLVDSLRLVPYSNRLKLNIKKLACAHTKVERIRKDVARKNARLIEKHYARVAVEEHGLVFMQKNRRLAKASSDVAIGIQKNALRSAMGPGRYFEATNRRLEGGNSQTCLCGAQVPKTLKDRVHICPECGLTGPRDQVSAIICQHTSFGSVPALRSSSITSSKECMPGLGILERAVKALETRRGESKGRRSESCTAESHTARAGEQSSDQVVQNAADCVPTHSHAVALKSSVKRPAQRKRSMRHTTGEAQAASVEVNTTDHAGPAGSWFVETKDCVPNGRFPIPKKVASTQKHTP